MSTTAYAIAPLTATERAGNRPDECGCCDRSGLKHIVKLKHRDGGTVWMGTGCAAVTLYGRRDQANRVVTEFNAIDHAEQQNEELRAERRTRYTVALAAFNTGDENTLYDTNVRRAYFAMGASPILGSFPAWLARVADTGELD